MEHAANAYVGDVDGKRPDIRPRYTLHHDLVLDGIAHDKDDEPLPLHIQRQRPRERQSRRPGDDHNLQPSSAARPFCASRLPAQPTAPVRPVEHRPRRQDDDARYDLMS